MISKQLLILAAVIIFFSCDEKNKYPYAIKDFRETLQPHLFRIVTKGIVGWDRTFERTVTDKELMMLSKCEHPLLRATALREMLQRKSFNHFNVLIHHLDDTATIPIDEGEFGIWYRTVSDDLLSEAARTDSAAKNKTNSEVLTKHNYLQTAYRLLEELEPQEKYYSIIKDMAIRPRTLDWEGNELGFNDIEYALYGLAKFRKNGDIKIIKTKLTEHVWEIGEISFRLMREFPDTGYLDVLQAYHHQRFYDLCRENNYSSKPIDFIDALAVYEDVRSAKIIDTIFRQLPLVKCRFDETFIHQRLVAAIAEHTCPAFNDLAKKHRKELETYSKYMIKLDSMFGSRALADTTPIENIPTLKKID